MRGAVLGVTMSMVKAYPIATTRVLCTATPKKKRSTLLLNDYIADAENSGRVTKMKIIITVEEEVW